MTALEEITLAIDTLERLKAESTEGPWERRLYDGVRGPSKSRLVNVIEPENEYGYDRVGSLADYMLRANAELVVTLYRTIDAQLAILRIAESQMEYWQRFTNKPEDLKANLALARAINGGAS